MKVLSVVLLLLVLALPACKDNGTGPDTQQPPPAAGLSYKTDVLPILQAAGCTGCHGGTANLTVGTVAGLLQGGLHGPAIVPGRGDSSNIVRKISPNPPFGERMPQGGPYLDSTRILTIKTWIDQGAKDN